jgi:hypothetical protein
VRETPDWPYQKWRGGGLNERDRKGERDAEVQGRGRKGEQECKEWAWLRRVGRFIGLATTRYLCTVNICGAICLQTYSLYGNIFRCMAMKSFSS